MSARSAKRQDLDKQLWIVISMREDFVTGLDPYLHKLADGLRNHFYMQQLDRRAALQAITNPVKDIRPFEDDAAELLVDNLMGVSQESGEGSERQVQFVEPVQLQAVCYQMWERLETRPGDTITVKDVEDFADVDRALMSFYEDTISDTLAETNVSEIELRNWFTNELITEAGTRNMVYRGDDFTGKLPTETADFVRSRFILREVVRPAGVWYELVHDRFVHPIKESNRAWRLANPLINLAQQWKDSEWADDALLSGRQFDRFANTNWQALGPLVAKFMEASQNGRDKELALEEERLREVEEQRERAEEAQVAEQRQRRLTRIAFGTMGLAIVLAILAFSAMRTAETAKTEADEAKLLAQKDASRAETAERNMQKPRGYLPMSRNKTRLTRKRGRMPRQLLRSLLPAWLMRRLRN